MLDLNSLLVGTSQVEVMAKFYSQVFERDADMIEGGYHGWKVGNCFFTVGEHSQVKGDSKEPQRVIFNLETKEVQKEFDRIKDIDGVKVIKEPYDLEGGLVATLSDPDGNYFQLMTPWEM